MPRLRDLNIAIGDLPTGLHNAITDVPGIYVGHTTVIYDEPRIARTGVTAIVPREGNVHKNPCFGAYHSFNGNGEMTGVHWLAESGMIGAPIAITNTHQVGVVRDALVEYETRAAPDSFWLLPIVAETYDGWLNDINAFHLNKEHLFAALDGAKRGPVDEGSVGGGTGMICHGFKGGIGTASRLVEIGGTNHTVGVLVQANYGLREDLRLDGIPIGRLINRTHTPAPRDPVHGAKEEKDGSIIIIIATDAPLLPFQCKRLAQRATVGLARVGGYGHNSSGDIFLALATGNNLTFDTDNKTNDKQSLVVQMLPNESMDPLFHATAEATEEAIWNALCAAETMTGFRDRTVYALPLEELQEIWQRFAPHI